MALHLVYFTHLGNDYRDFVVKGLSNTFSFALIASD